MPELVAPCSAFTDIHDRCVKKTPLNKNTFKRKWLFFLFLRKTNMTYRLSNIWQVQNSSPFLRPQQQQKSCFISRLKIWTFALNLII